MNDNLGNYSRKRRLDQTIGLTMEEDFFFIVFFDHERIGILFCYMKLFMWINNPLWIEDSFYLLKESIYVFTIHFFKVWCSDETIVMFTTRGSFVFKNDRKYFIH